MSLHAQYRKDKATAWIKPTAGVEIEVSHFDPRQPDYINNMTRITKPVRKLVEKNLLTPEQDRKYAIEAFIATCVKGWRTVAPDGEIVSQAITVKPGEEMAFTPENAASVFMRYPQFYNDTLELARDLSAFQVDEDEVKN